MVYGSDRQSERRQDIDGPRAYIAHARAFSSRQYIFLSLPAVGLCNRLLALFNANFFFPLRNEIKMKTRSITYIYIYIASAMLCVCIAAVTSRLHTTDADGCGINLAVRGDMSTTVFDMSFND